MEKHIQLVGILNIVYRGAAIVGAFLLVILCAWFGHFIESLIHWGSLDSYDVPPQVVLDIVPIVLFALAVMIFVVSVVGIVAAVGVLKRKEWGRIVLLVVSFVNLLHIPVGTALGVYSIWVLMKDETIRIFNSTSGSHVASPTV